MRRRSGYGYVTLCVDGLTDRLLRLGRPGGPGSGPVALYDSSGRQLTGFIGDAAPEDVRWYPNRSLVVVSVQGRQYTVQVAGGSIVDATERLSNPQFSARGFGSSTIPSGVVQGSEFAPGQQLRMLQRSEHSPGQATTSSPDCGFLGPRRLRSDPRRTASGRPL